MTPERSYLVCATPRSGSTLVCEALKETGVAGRPEEYFEALRHSGRPRAPAGVLPRRRGPLDPRSPRRARVGAEPPPRSPLWSRAAYDRYLEWAFEAGTTPNGVFGAKLMWGYFGDFVSLLRNDSRLPRRAAPRAPADRLPRPHLRPRRPRQQGAPGGLALEGGADRDLARGPGQRQGSLGRGRTLSLRALHRGAPARSCASTTRRSTTCWSQILVEEASWDAFFEHCGIKPSSSSTRTSPPTTRRPAPCVLLERLGLEAPEGFEFEPRMKRQSDRINDDWTKRYSELKLNTDPDLATADSRRRSTLRRPSRLTSHCGDTLCRRRGGPGVGSKRRAA